MKKTYFIVLCAMALTIFASSCNSNRSETVNTEVIDSTAVDTTDFALAVDSVAFSVDSVDLCTE